MKERLPALQFVDVDGDGVCDVAIRMLRPEVVAQTYSTSGTGPWVHGNVIGGTHL